MKFRSKLSILIRAAAVLALWCTADAQAQFAIPRPAASEPLSEAVSAAKPRVKVQSGDYIVAVVNEESVTANEVRERMGKMRAEAAQKGGSPPTEAELHKQAEDSLIEERVVVTYARDAGIKIDDGEIDRAIANIASGNKLSVSELRQRLREQGGDYATFRANLRDQLLIERIREREVVQRIRVTGTEIDDYIDRMKAKTASTEQVDLAQILIPVPDGAGPEIEQQRRSRAEQALARLQNGEPFEQVARDMSEDANHARGGEMGARPLDRYPDLFVQAIDRIKVGGVTGILRSGAGFHILKLLSRGEQDGMAVTETHVRHILLRPSAELTVQAAERRLEDFRQQIASGARTFEEVARQSSEDGSAASGGDLGWAAPGQFVPEFELAMDRLPVGGLSGPVRSRFGVHLIQVIERRQTTLDPKQVREQATNALREQKFEQAYTEWVADLRAKAFIEYREPPV